MWADCTLSACFICCFLSGLWLAVLAPARAASFCCLFDILVVTGVDGALAAEGTEPRHVPCPVMSNDVTPWQRGVAQGVSSGATRDPTRQAARYTGGLSVLSFLKCLSWQRPSAESAREVARATAHISRMEGMEGHARAADIRSRL